MMFVEVQNQYRLEQNSTEMYLSTEATSRGQEGQEYAPEWNFRNDIYTLPTTRFSLKDYILKER